MGAGQSRRQKGPHTASCLPVLTLFAGYFSFICIINGNCSVSPSQPIDNHHRVCTTDKPIREGQNGASDCSVCAELRSHPSKHPRRLHRSNSSAEQPVVTREQKSPKSLHVEVSLVVHLVQDLLSVCHGCVKYHRPLFLRRKRNFTAAETCRIENYGNRN